ncbi:MAG: hypothetical protein AMDU1_APLC00033G0028 [Thermoplasmatales archaeon A-plasma]|jgi:hypothetical protein|nr:MAG: hypothetical protein AMDU1_APLC00033G0028 [Thermoplasmatales archaeon A-plasma]
MNKKLLVLALVPVLVVMSGALAFSAFSGSITTNVSATAGYMSYNQNMVLTGYYSDNTLLTLAYGNYPANGSLTASMSTMTLPVNYTGHVNSNLPIDLGWAGLHTQANNSVKSQTVEVEGMAPGSWAQFEFTITNNGSVGFIITTGTPVGSQSSTVTSGMTNFTTASSASAFTTDMSSDSGYVIYVSSVPATSMDSGSSVSYYVYVGLGGGSNNYWAESSFNYAVPFTITSDP